MVFVVVPAYNEEQEIGRVVRGLFQHGWNKIVVVNDGSSDETAAVARAAGATVLCHEINRGQGAALQTGNDYCLAAGAQTVVHFDGDGQFNPADIAGAVTLLENKNLDVIIGSRFLDQRSIIPWFKRLFILPVARLINHFLTGLKLSDAHNGFRVLNRRAASIIIINQDGMAHNSEISYQIKKNNLNFTEYPVEVKYFENGQGIGGGIKIIIDFIIDKIIS